MTVASGLQPPPPIDATGLFPVERRALLDQAQEIVWNDAYWIFLWRDPIYAGESDRIAYTLRPDDYVEIYRAKLVG